MRSLFVVFLAGCSAEPAPFVRPPVCVEIEVFYDGVDGACDGGDDFDADGDGFPREVDCNDFDDSVYPGAPGEVFYDGIDTDCAGDDDFDADGDGWFPDGYEGAFAEYVFNYLDEIAPDHHPGDCDDADPNVNPRAEDVPYDGVDADCQGNDDYDGDGDGFVATGYLDLGSGQGFGDCDDFLDTVNPGQAERAVTWWDDDCDGGGTTASLGILEGTFEGISGVKLVRGGISSILVADVQSAVSFGVTHQSLVALGMGGIGGPLGRPQLLQLADGGRPFDVQPDEEGFTLASFQDQVLETAAVLDAPGFALVNQGSQISALDAVGQPVFTWDGLLICGEYESVLGDAVLPGAAWCGPWGKGVLFCDEICDWHEREVEPFGTRPQRVGEGWMLVDGALLDAGRQPIVELERLEDADVDGEFVAWIREGEVWVRGPWGVVGPLPTTRWGWTLDSELPERVAFQADRVFVDARGPYLTVWAVDSGRGSVGFARFGP